MSIDTENVVTAVLEPNDDDSTAVVVDKEVKPNKVKPAVKEVAKPKSTPIEAKSESVIVAGQAVEINPRCFVYPTAAAKAQCSSLIGTSYIFDPHVSRGRIQVSSAPEGRGELLGWIDVTALSFK